MDAEQPRPSCPEGPSEIDLPLILCQYGRNTQGRHVSLVCACSELHARAQSTRRGAASRLSICSVTKAVVVSVRNAHTRFPHPMTGTHVTRAQPEPHMSSRPGTTPAHRPSRGSNHLKVPSVCRGACHAVCRGYVRCWWRVPAACAVCNVRVPCAVPCAVPYRPMCRAVCRVLCRVVCCVPCRVWSHARVMPC